MMNPDSGVLPVAGVRLGTAAAGIKYADRDDLVVIEIPAGATCAGVFTRNAFCAAPVQVAREHLQRAQPRYLLINSGNANAGTGDQGMTDARHCCEALAQEIGCAPDQVLPFSTGVIGETLPMEKMLQALPAALQRLDSADWEAAAAAIMTTDTVPKLLSRTFELEGERITVTGMAKGSGMIRPDMATMLAFLATDAGVTQPLLQRCLEDAVAPSFNSITVDGDTSTNDACMLIASGANASSSITGEQSEGYRKLAATVEEVCRELARSIVKDGEGATKLVTVEVITALSPEEAREVAFTVAHSPLVKTALFASDPNWGRILAAVGRAGVRDLDISGVDIWLDEVCIVSGGGVDPAYTEQAGQRAMERDELTIRIGLGRGEAGARVLTCDFSYDYVRINAEYRT
jgi:glutamate N-acetyltransferase/amino-acid N-acetyltransferase